MKVEVQNELLPFVNQKSFDRHIKVYVEARLDTLRKSLENQSDINEIYKTQGQIREVKRLLSLSDEVKTRTRE